jgi:hypothetical protein
MDKESLNQTSPSTWHRRFRLSWYPALSLALAILLASIPGYLTPIPLGLFEERLAAPQSPLLPAFYGLISLVSFSSALLSIGLGVLLYVRKSWERMGLFLAYYLLLYGILLSGPIEQLQPFWPAAPWVNSFVLLPFLIGPFTTALIGLFPDGRFVPDWTRWLVPLSLIIFPISLVSGGQASSFEITQPTLILIIALGLLFSIGLATGEIYAQVYRYRRVSSATERQQTKIVLYGIALWFLLMAFSSIGWIVGFSLPEGSPAPWWLPIGSLMWAASTLLLPVSLTVAVLRYRLFDIDILVHRTLVYGVLTIMLAIVFFALVTVTQTLTVAVTGQQSSAAIVLSTLAIAALFTPLRRRIQNAIDRRFYRRKYDSEKALAAFSLAIRDEVDIESLTLALLAIVEETMQPENASVWLQVPPTPTTSPQQRGVGG